MTRSQRMVSWLFADAEAETRRWGFTCNQCGARSDVWEAGGVRYKASGNPTSLLRCPKCGQRTFSQIARDTVL